MEKLLHERLREWAKHDSERSLYPVIKAAREFGIKSTGAAEERELFEKFADEIERYYIPRPRFEDGEPIDYGSEDIKWGDGGDYVFNAINDKGIPCAFGLGLVCAEAEMTYGGFVKRPTPKVCDADGVEIKVGDTVWEIEHGYEYSAIGVNQDGIRVKHHSVTAYEMTYQPDQLTHERPVFDAEGVRICKGDTVWFVRSKDTRARTVDDIEPYDGEMCAVIGSMHYNPKNLTHREPDSIQKVVDDMDASLRGMKVCDLQGYIDRLTALIERGA